MVETAMAPVEQVRRSAFWKGFWIAAIVTAIIVGFSAYMAGIEEGVRQCEQVARESAGFMQCQSQES